MQGPTLSPFARRTGHTDIRTRNPMETSNRNCETYDHVDLRGPWTPWVNHPDGPLVHPQSTRHFDMSLRTRNFEERPSAPGNREFGSYRSAGKVHERLTAASNSARRQAAFAQNYGFEEAPVHPMDVHQNAVTTVRPHSPWIAARPAW